MSADACLFTPASADYSQTYTVSTVVGDSLSTSAKCLKTITKSNDVLKWDLSYDELAVCGFGWDSSDAEINFGGHLRASSNINTIHLQEQCLLFFNFDECTKKGFGDHNLSHLRYLKALSELTLAAAADQ